MCVRVCTFLLFPFLDFPNKFTHSWSVYNEKKEGSNMLCQAWLEIQAKVA